LLGTLPHVQRVHDVAQLGGDALSDALPFQPRSDVHNSHSFPFAFERGTSTPPLPGYTG
jgi:hypothetical protein